MGGIFFLFPAQAGAKANVAVKSYRDCSQLVREIYGDVRVTQLRYTKRAPRTGDVVYFRGTKSPHYAIVIAVINNYIVLEEYNWPWGHHTIGRKVKINDRTIIGYWAP